MKRALLVGAGGMGQAWARNLAEHGEVVIDCWVDVREGAAKAAAEANHLEGIETSLTLEAALKRDTIDFVVDVTIPEAHKPVTIAALEAGFPVIGEKPMATSLDDAHAMIAASEKAGKLYMVSQSRRFDQRLLAYKGLVSELGLLGIAKADFYIGAHFGGFRDVMDNVLLVDMAIHTFDQARAITGADPVSVYCEEFNPSWSWYRTGSSAFATFEMSDGCMFQYSGSWASEGLPTSWEAAWRVVGERGTALWDGHSAIESELVTGTDGFHRPVEKKLGVVTPGKEGISGSLQAFLDAVETGETPIGECHDNVKSLAMVLAAVESSKSRQRVPVRF